MKVLLHACIFVLNISFTYIISKCCHALASFLMTAKCTRPAESCNFGVIEKLLVYVISKLHEKSRYYLYLWPKNVPSKGQLFYKYGFEANCGRPPPPTPFSYAAA